MTIGSPTRERTRRRSSIQNSGIATASAEANTSYRYRPSNRSASWMRNHEASSPFVSTIPNSTPARKYAGSRRSRARATEVTGTVIVTVSPRKEQRQQETARQGPGRDEREDPQAGPYPVVLEERDVPRDHGGAEVAEIAGHAQLCVADHEQTASDEP